MTAVPIETDALVIGAGPVGLWQVFQLGLQDIRCHLVDALPHLGGQPVELYPDKPIYDIPGIPVCSGRELVERLQQQIQPFAPGLHLGQVVSQVQRREDGRLDVTTSRGTRFITRTLFIAAGVGAFVPRRLKLDGLDAFDGQQLHHQWPHQQGDASAWADQRVVVHGGEDAALQAALNLAEAAAPPLSVTLLHRRDAFQASDELVARLRTHIAAGRIQLCIGQPVGIDTSANRLQALQIVDPQGDTHPLPLDQLLVCLGLSPRLGPVADWGLAIERKQLVVNPATSQTNEPGIFAVGDINTYPGKKKLILCGFHEATLAAFAAVESLFPEQRQLLQYTTTSPKLHRLLGVNPG